MPSRELDTQEIYKSLFGARSPHRPISVLPSVILIGFLDALPFIGTGTILLPWAALELFRGDFFHAAAYLTFFLITNSTRDFLEPRLLGEKLGVYPIVIAVVVYVGICIFGPAGVLLGPLMLLVIREVIREWLEA